MTSLRMAAQLNSSTNFGSQQKRAEERAQRMPDYLVAESRLDASTSVSTSSSSASASAAQQLDCLEDAVIEQRERLRMHPGSPMLAWRGKGHAAWCAMLLLLGTILLASPAGATTMSWYCNSYSAPPNTPTTCPFCVPSAPCSVSHYFLTAFMHAWYPSLARMCC